MITWPPTIGTEPKFDASHNVESWDLQATALLLCLVGMANSAVSCDHEDSL